MVAPKSAFIPVLFVFTIVAGSWGEEAPQMLEPRSRRVSLRNCRSLRRTRCPAVVELVNLLRTRGKPWQWRRAMRWMRRASAAAELTASD